MLLIYEMRDLNIQMNNLQEILGGVFDNVIDDRGIGSPGLSTKKSWISYSVCILNSIQGWKCELQPNKCRQGIKLFDGLRH